MIFGGERPIEDRLFEAALSLPPDEREAFIRHGAAGDEAVYRAVQELVHSWHAGGGDDAPVTLGEAHSARHAWAVADAEKPGTTIDHFKLVRRIGEGGMGTVWEAEQTGPVERHVALKIIKLGMDTVEVVNRFERERQTLAQMNHPHIAQVFEAGATSLGRPYFAMELVRGRPVTEHCKHAGLDLHQRLALFLDVCAAVEHAHQKGIIHRDLKPSNILVSDGRIKVIDFGVAKATRADAGPLVTRHSQVVGTPAYMSPEQASGGGTDIDTRSDVYSLGVVLYEILTEQLPFDPERFENTGLAEIQRILRDEEPPKPSTRISQAPRTATRPQARILPHRELDWIVMRAIAKERERRYPSAAALAADIHNYLDGDVVAAVPPTLLYHTRKFARKNRLMVAAVAMVIVALAAALTVSLLQVGRANTAQRATTITVADLYTRNGLNETDPKRAALWFAKAATTATSDPARVDTNLLRASTWRNQKPAVVRAFDTGFRYVESLSWNPGYPALITLQNDPANPAAAVWDTASSTLWQPGQSPSWQAASWSPDGNHIAVVDDSHVRVLSFPDGSPLAELPITGTASPPSWSPDGRSLAIAATTAASTVWDWRQNNRSPFSTAFPSSPIALHFSRDGQALLVVGSGWLAACNPQHPSQLLWPILQINPKIPARLLGNGTALVAADADSPSDLVVRDSLTGSELERYTTTAEPDTYYRLAAAPDGRFLALSDGSWIDRQTTSLSIRPEIARDFDGHTFHPDGSEFAIGTPDGEFRRWSLPGGEPLGTIDNGNYTVIDCAFSPDGSHIATSEQGLVRIWQSHQPHAPTTLAFPHTSLARLSPDGQAIAPSGYSHIDFNVPTTRLFATATGTPLGPPIDVGGTLMDVAFSADGTRLALAVSTTPDRPNAPFSVSSGGGSGFVQWVDPRSATPLGPPIPMPSEPRGLSIHPIEPVLGVCCAAGQGIEINTESGTIHTLFTHEKTSHPHEFANNGRCAYSPDGRVFIVWGLYQYLHLWHRPSGRHLVAPHQTGHFPDLDVHANNLGTTWIDYRSELRFIDLHTGAAIAPAIHYTSAPWVGQFNQAGDRFLAAGGDGLAQVWDWQRGTSAGPTFPHGTLVSAGRFLPGDQTRCVTGDFSGTLHFWDYRSGTAVRPPLSNRGHPLLDLHITPDARHLIAAHSTPSGIVIHDLSSLFPPLQLDPGAALLLAEIDANAEIHPNGGIVPLSSDAWLEKWDRFRERYPDFAGHRPLPKK